MQGAEAVHPSAPIPFMSKLIIWVSGRPNLDGYKKREFVWNEQHRAFIYEGREFDAAEFNEKFDKAWRNNQDLAPRARVVGLATPVAPPPAPHIADEAMSVEQAESILNRFAPERLKKKPGRKPATEMVTVE